MNCAASGAYAPVKGGYRTGAHDVMSNSAMDHAEHIDKRLNDLEIKASFTDDLLDEINQTLYRQQQQIDQLTRELLTLREQSADTGGQSARSLHDELPPHY